MNNQVIMFIGICGPSGSGKSLLCEKIKNLSEDDITILGEDRYYHSVKDGENPAEHNFDVPESIDFDLMVQDVEKLLNGESIDAPIYDFKIHKRKAETDKIFPKKIIIVEGILIFTTEKLMNILNLKVYVEAEQLICYFRREERDVRERGRTIESVRYQYLKQVLPAFNKYVKPSSKLAQITIHNNEENNYDGMDALTTIVKYRLHL